jgi:hypothetical protein
MPIGLALSATERLQDGRRGTHPGKGGTPRPLIAEEPTRGQSRPEDAEDITGKIIQRCFNPGLDVRIQPATLIEFPVMA